VRLGGVVHEHGTAEGGVREEDDGTAEGGVVKNTWQIIMHTDINVVS